MRRAAMLALALLVCCTANGLARYKDNREVKTLGFSPSSCGSWLEERALKNAQAHEGWILGYLTAVNVQVDTESDILKDTDASAALAWIDNYCRAHPLDSLNLAADLLAHELADRAKPKQGQ